MRWKLGVGRWKLGDEFTVVGDGVEAAGFAHAFAFVINDEAALGVETGEADMDLAVG